VRMGTTRMINIGMGISALGTIAILAVVLLDLAGPGPLFVVMIVYVFGNGVALPSLTAVAISVNPAITGAAAGLLGFLQWTSGVTATAIVSVAGLTNVGALHAVMLGFAVFSFITLLFTRR
jgi:DHA1 family bicyclomycin/chloramphenicol resistance-like MFS transporter